AFKGGCHSPAVKALPDASPRGDVVNFRLFAVPDESVELPLQVSDPAVVLSGLGVDRCLGRRKWMAADTLKMDRERFAILTLDLALRPPALAAVESLPKLLKGGQLFVLPGGDLGA